jgi:hypothetical protein
MRWYSHHPSALLRAAAAKNPATRGAPGMAQMLETQRAKGVRHRTRPPLLPAARSPADRRGRRGRPARTIAAQGTDARRVAPARCRAWIPQSEADRRRATGHDRHAEVQDRKPPRQGLKPWPATGFMSTATAAVPGRRFLTGRCRYGLRLLSASPGLRPEMQLARAGSHEVMLREHQAACRASEARASRPLRASDRMAAACESRGLRPPVSARRARPAAAASARHASPLVSPGVAGFARQHREGRTSFLR